MNPDNVAPFITNMILIFWLSWITLELYKISKQYDKKIKALEKLHKAITIKNPFKKK